MFIRKSLLSFTIGVCLLAAASFSHAAASDINVAMHKPATQSSTASDGLPERAVDGNTDGNYRAGSVTHTSNAPQQWWQVDLTQYHYISSIRIWNRTDCCGQRLSKFYVFVSNKPFTSGNIEQTKLQPGVWNKYYDGVAGRTTDIPVNQTGRYIRIQLAGAEYLSLAEVQVLVPPYRWEAFTGAVPSNAFTATVSYSGKPLPICRAKLPWQDSTQVGWFAEGKCSIGWVGSGVTLGSFEVLTTPYTVESNLALNKPATQSSTAYDGAPRRAVDGNMNGIYFAGKSVTHTKKAPQQWWQVDLGGVHRIGSIRIWNRTDCCGQRLSKFYVFVSGYPFISTNPEVIKRQPFVWNKYYDGAAGRPTEIAVGRLGRFVRIQLTGTEHLSLAEVQVMSSLSPRPLKWCSSDKCGAEPSSAVKGGFYIRPWPICRWGATSNKTQLGSVGIVNQKIVCHATDLYLKDIFIAAMPFDVLIDE